MRARSLLLVAILLLFASLASAQSTSLAVTGDDAHGSTVIEPVHGCLVAEPRAERAWRLAFASADPRTAVDDESMLRVRWSDAWLPQDQASQETPRRRPKAVEYSEGYETRMKVHRYASFATLPLAVTELVLGQSLYSSPTRGKRSAHTGVALGLGGLFGVNSVTGVWNLTEARKDPNGRTRRILHAVLMLAADAGFVATAALAPNRERGFEGQGQQLPLSALPPASGRARHRAIAFTSLGTAVASYVMMLVWRP